MPEKGDSPSRREVDVAVESLTRRLNEARMTELDLRAQLRALIDALVAAGALPPEDYERRRQLALSRELARVSEQPLVEMEHEFVDKYALGDLPAVDCAAILPVCEARCCRLRVPLSAQDLDERTLHWDYGRPYVLRRDPQSGYCVHADPQTHACTAYAQRPGTCRIYDCRDDRRIWVDFEKRILAPDDGQFE